ncbi:MAG: hypothetical protein RIF33_04785 [Cyclobacteriaceae bacterium]
MKNSLRGAVTVLIVLFSSWAFGQEETTGWPRLITTTNGEEITLYQPQADQFQNNILEGRMAVSVKGKKGKLLFGAVWLKTFIATDLDANTAAFERIEITQTRFPEDISDANIEGLKELIVNEITSWEPKMSLDALKASLSSIEDGYAGDQSLKHDPPSIYYRQNPTVLVSIDGEPVVKKLDNSSIEYVVNSPFFIAKQTNGNEYYLKGDKYWYASKEVTDRWESTTKVPKEIKDLAAENAPEGMTQSNPTLEDENSGPPAILVSTVPAELIIVNGTPDYQPIKETQLLYVKNSENDIIMDINGQKHYVLIAGRFYGSETLEDGDWAFVNPADLPEDFSKIPDEETISSIQASVPGTEESHDALLEQSIPQTAQVDRSKTMTVEYDGEPKFEDVTGTEVAYALNSPQTVIRVNNKYYCVDDGIWFVSGQPNGTFAVATERPEEVDDLPASCPVYNIKYVYVYDVQPEIVYVGYTPGYYHSYVYMGTVVYGTGYYYRPWYGAYYYPRPVTYGFSVHWNPYSGWGFNVGFSYGWVGWGFHPYYRPYWGPRGYHAGYRHGYHNGYHRGYRAGYAAGYRNAQRKNIYSNRTGVRTLGKSNYVANNRKIRPGNANVTRPQNNKSARPATNDLRSRVEKSSRPNNVATDRQGNVFQRDKSGQWQGANKDRSRNQPAARPSTQQSQQLNRTQNNRQYYNGGGSRGGSRGGGGRIGGRRN